MLDDTKVSSSSTNSNITSQNSENSHLIEKLDVLLAVDEPSSRQIQFKIPPSHSWKRGFLLSINLEQSTITVQENNSKIPIDIPIHSDGIDFVTQKRERKQLINMEEAERDFRYILSF